jgi:hypothetical protein
MAFSGDGALSPEKARFTRVISVTFYRSPAPLGMDHRRAILPCSIKETSMTKFKTFITAAIAALALTTASLAVPGQAFAGGRHGGFGHGHHGIGHGHFGGHGIFGHGHHHHHRPFFAYNSCWKWSPYGPVNVCRYY